VIVTKNLNRKSDRTSRILVDSALKHFPTAFILFLVLALSSETRAEEEPFSSTVAIGTPWYVDEQEFEWNVIGNNLSALEIWYSYGNEAYDNSTLAWSLYETIDNLTGQNETGQFTFNFSEGTGYYILESNLFDTANNSELGNTSTNFTGGLIKFDDVGPESATILNSGFRPTNSSINIPWSATDNFLLKNIRLEYRFSPDIQTIPGNWELYGATNAEGVADSGQFTGFYFLNGEGRYDFRLIARDRAGNEEVAEIDTFVVLDGTLAQTNYTYDGDYWVAGNTLVPWQVSDNYELYNIEMRYSYKPDNSSEFGAWESFQTMSLTGVAAEGDFNFNFNKGQGVYNFWLITNDEAGNSNPGLDAGMGELSLGYDNENPTGGMDYVGGFWQNSEVTIQHFSVDNVDVAEVSLYYRFKEDNLSLEWSSYSLAETYGTSGGTVTNGIMKADALNGSGIYQFRIEVKDSAGNGWTSPDSEFEIGFDMEDPEIFLLNVEIESSYIFYNDGILYYNSLNAVTDKEIKIAGYCHDPTSGIVEGSTTFESSFASFTDDSEGSTWSTTFTFRPATSGNHTITITALDNAGNSGSITIPVVDDTEPPVTEIAMIISGGMVIDETDNYSISLETKFSLSSYDAVSGKESIEYRFNEGDWLIYSNRTVEGKPFTVPPKTNLIEYRAKDYVGNLENLSSRSVKLINEKPIATIHSPSTVNVEKGEKIYFNGTGNDPDGEILKYRWISDMDGFLSSSRDFNISNLSPGTHTIAFSVMDEQDSWSAVSIVTVNVSDSFSRNIIYLLVVLALASVLVGYNIYSNRMIGKENYPDAELENTGSQEEIPDAEQSLNCASCGTGVKLDAKFCKNCGSNLDEDAEPAIKCAGCGEMVPMHKNFCKNCGEKID